MLFFRYLYKRFDFRLKEIIKLFFLISIFLPSSILYAADFSLEFDGSDDKVEVPLHTSLNPSGNFSVNAWVKTQQNTDWQSAITSRGSNTGYKLYQQHPDGGSGGTGRAFAVWSGNGSAWKQLNSNELPNWGTWQMQTLTFDNSTTTMRLYVDGVEIDEFNSGSLSPNTQNVLRIGTGGSANAKYYFKGHIDEVAVWAATLSADAVAQLYNSGETLYAGDDYGNYTSSASLREYWTMDSLVSNENNGTGSSTLFGEKNNNDGTIYGAVWSSDTPGTDPTLSSTSPSDGATFVAKDANIVLNFSEIIKVGTGNIVLRKTKDNSIVQSFDVTSDVTLSTNTQITINPTADLEDNTNYAIQIDATAIVDISRNNFAGIGSSDVTTYNFSTGSGSPLDDKDVVGLIEAQTEAPKKIVTRVTTPIFNRLNWIRGYSLDDELLAQKINFKFNDPKLNELSELISQSIGTTQPEKNFTDNWLFWSEGSVGIGTVDATDKSSKKDIDTNAVTLGMDKKINQSTLHGFTLTYTQENVDVGNAGTSSDIDSYSFSTYRTINMNDNIYLEGILGLSKLDIKNVRRSGESTLSGFRNGKQLFGSLQYINSFKKNNSDISPNIRLDLSYTTLDEYDETGTSPLKYGQQNIETMGLYTGFTVNNEISKNDYILRPIAGFEVGLDLSPNSDASVNYVSDPNTKYTKSIDQADDKSYKGKIGFDVLKKNGWSLMTFYEINQTDNSQSDTFYFLTGYTKSNNQEYVMGIRDENALISYKRKIKGFDVNLGSNYNLLSKIPDYGINFEVSSKF